MITCSGKRPLSVVRALVRLAAAMAFLFAAWPAGAAASQAVAQGRAAAQEQAQTQTKPAAEGHHPGGHPGEAMPRGGACEQEGGELHTFEDTQRWVEMFERPERAATQKPDEVVAALHLQPGQTVADLGAGSGYFTFRLARAVGPDGRVLAVDIEPGMLDAIRKRGLDEKGGEGVSTILADQDNPNLPDGQVDLVLVVDTFHHLHNRVAYLRGLARDLSRDGRVAIVDFKKEELPIGPPLEHKLARETVIGEFEEAGYTLAREESFLPYQYFLIFKK